jgi:hypothetical protein
LVRECIAVVVLVALVVDDAEVVVAGGQVREGDGEAVARSRSGQLLHRRLTLLSLLEEDGATRVAAGVAEGEGLALDDVECEVGKGRLSQGHGDQSRGGNNGILHVCGSG